MRYNYIAIEGNIGAGKTSLSSKIAKEFNGRLILEQFEDNDFLPKFYEDPEKYAFPLEMSFLASRFQQLKDELSSQDLFLSFTISDYFIPKSFIFARNNLPALEYKLFSKFFELVDNSLPKPEILVYLYLDIDNLLSNIDKRGRDYEVHIKAEYLRNVQESYFNYFRQRDDLRILIIDTNNVDFVNNQMDYENILDLIDREYPKGIHRRKL